MALASKATVLLRVFYCVECFGTLINGHEVEWTLENDWGRFGMVEIQGRAPKEDK